jgi:hypothetical protein
MAQAFLSAVSALSAWALRVLVVLAYGFDRRCCVAGSSAGESAPPRSLLNEAAIFVLSSAHRTSTPVPPIHVSRETRLVTLLFHVKQDRQLTPRHSFVPEAKGGRRTKLMRAQVSPRGWAVAVRRPRCGPPPSSPAVGARRTRHSYWQLLWSVDLAMQLRTGIALGWGSTDCR